MQPSSAVAPLLVFGWGNLSRGDDALGPIFVDRLCAALDPSLACRVEFLTDHQLQVEHALDLIDRSRVLFVDASLNCAAPFQVSALQATHEQSISTHGLSPATVLQVFRRLQGCDPPESTQLAIRGERFELGAAVSESAALHLERALIWGLRWLISSSVGKQASGNPQTQKPTSLLDVGF
jgi:hydrogenase maturation protease